MPTTMTVEQQRRKELERVQKKGKGVLDCEKVVEFAKNPETALHECFEWDNEVAGHKYRLQQARTVIRVYVTTVETPSGDQEHRQFVHIAGERGYRSIKDVLTDEEKQEKYFKTVERDFRALERKWKNTRLLNEKYNSRLRPLFDKVDEVFGPDDNDKEGPRAEI